MKKTKYLKLPIKRKLSKAAKDELSFFFLCVSLNQDAQVENNFVEVKQLPLQQQHQKYIE